MRTKYTYIKERVRYKSAVYMIGSEEMSSTSMDISETFRPEDLSKTDFFDFVTAPDMGIGIGVGNDRPPGSSDANGTSDPALQGYDQFWSSDKDTHSRLESTIFEDLDRYCWQQQHQSQSQAHHNSPQLAQSRGSATNPSASAGSSISQPGQLVGGGANANLENTDGQIYTLTVLNGNEPWLKRDPDAQMPAALDLDSLLGNFSGYIKTEYPYDDSGFSTDGNKDPLEISNQQQQQHLQSSIPVTTVVTANNSTTNLTQFQNNNNDWHIADNNSEQNSAESLLRSALQGKGYSKGLHISNGIALLPSPNPVKEEDLRRALFPTDTDSLNFADSSLSGQIFDDSQTLGNSSSSSTNSHPSHANNTATTNPSSTNHSTSTAGLIVDDMFLPLESAFTDEFDKIKRIANEVQQFCTSSDYPEIIMEITSHMPTGAQGLAMQQQQPPPLHPVGHPQQREPQQPMQAEVSTSGSITPSARTSLTSSKSTAKKYKRPNLNNNNNNSRSSNNNNNMMNNNNNNSSPSNNISTNNQCNGQRKERSLHYCSICSKGFKDKYSVNVHIRTHTGEKPFACSLCGKSFRQKAHLAKHYQTHLAQKSNGNVVKGSKQSSSRSSSGSVQAQRHIRQNAPIPGATPSVVVPNGPSMSSGLMANI